MKTEVVLKLDTSAIPFARERLMKTEVVLKYTKYKLSFDAKTV